MKYYNLWGSVFERENARLLCSSLESEIVIWQMKSEAINMLKHPQVRSNLITYLKMLSDKELQERSLIGQDFSDGAEYDWLQFAVDFLFDDTGLGEDRGLKQIGYSLRNEDELLAVQKVTRAIDAVLDALPDTHSDQDYLQHPLWENVIATASEALKLIDQ